MAPERVDSTSTAAARGGYSYASDVWSAGLSLLAVAMGRFQYQDPSYLALVQANTPPTDEDLRRRPRPGASKPAYVELVDFVRLCLLVRHCRASLFMIPACVPHLRPACFPYCRKTRLNDQQQPTSFRTEPARRDRELVVL